MMKRPQKRPHENKTNPCARIIADIAHTCFLIGEETHFDADFRWSGHVSEVEVIVVPARSSLEHSVLEFREYLNIAGGDNGWVHPEFGTDTYPKVKAFAAKLKQFHQQHIAD